MKQNDTNLPLCDKCALETGSIFKHLTPEEVEMINFQKDFRQYRRGDILYQEGNRISGFYCINSGIIKVFKTGVDGKEQIIRFARKGEIIAYRSVLSNEPACTSAKVTVRCALAGTRGALNVLASTPSTSPAAAAQRSQPRTTITASR